jgi:hypothetical protein
MLDHAHAILASISLIQMVQSGARKAVTAEAEPGLTLRYLLAVFDSTRGTGF